MKKKNKLTVYACGVDWQYEMDAIPTTVYPSIEALKDDRACWPSCGIVKLTITETSWPEEQNFDFE